MAFVKLDTGILNSSLWLDRDAREVFVTSLLMAEPWDFPDPTPQLKVGLIEPSGWVAPPGRYGFVRAASTGIIHRCGIERELGLAALTRLGDPDPDSKDKDYDGRRMVRIDGGFIVLNYMKYREYDHTAAARSHKYRERKKEPVTRDGCDATVLQRDSSASVSTSFLEFWKAWPPHKRKKARPQCLAKWRLIDPSLYPVVLASVEAHKKSAGWLKEGGEYIPGPLPWLNQEGWTATPEVGTQGPKPDPAARVSKLWRAPDES